MSPRPGYREERQLWRSGFALIAGVDEAGRGPLAGPVVAAAVVLRRPLRLPAIDDSKKLAPAARAELHEAIALRAEAVAWARVEPEEIDRINILRASHAAMRSALDRLPASPEFVLIDGHLAPPGLPWPHRAVVRGDGLCAAIAAASIIAKVERDRIMEAYDVQYPGYGFAQHKGYPTPEHFAALERLGPSPIHRLTFRPLARQTTFAF